MKLALAAALLVLLAGCGGSDAKGVGKPAFDVGGTITVAKGLALSDGSCAGSSGFDDLVLGAPVVVRNADGKRVGLGNLEAGRTSGLDQGGYVSCTFKFDVSNVPSSAGVYSVEVTHRGEIPFKQEDAGHLSLTLG